MRRPFPLWPLLAGCCLATSAVGQSFEETLGLQPRRIALEQVIRAVLEKGLDARIEWLNWAVADRQIESSWGKFDPSYYLTSLYRDSSLPQNALEYVQTGGFLFALAEPNLFRQESLQSQTGLSGKLPTGTEYRLFIASGEFRNDINRMRPPAVFYPEYAVSLGISLNQPLLRDFGPDVQLAEVRVSRRNRAVADYRWETALRRGIARAVFAYYDLIFAVEDIAVKRDVVAFARALVAESQKQVGVGVLSPVDVQEAEVAVSVAREAVISALSFAVERQTALKNQILDDLSQSGGEILLPKDGLGTPQSSLSRETNLRSALARRPDYLATLEEAERAAVVVRYQKNQQLPRLDLQATLTVNGLDDRYSSAFDRALNAQGYDAQVGIQFSLPLGNRTGRANTAIAEYRQQQAILSIARSEITIGNEIDTLLGQLKALRAKLDSTTDSAGLAERLLETEQKRRAQGLARNFDILKARNALAEARTRRLAALADYNKATIELALANGTLLERFSITINRSAGGPHAKTVGKTVR